LDYIITNFSTTSKIVPGDHRAIGSEFKFFSDICIVPAKIMSSVANVSFDSIKLL